MNVNRVAIFTTGAGIAATLGMVYAAATTATVVATVAYAILAVAIAACTCAVISAWKAEKARGNRDDAAAFFAKVVEKIDEGMASACESMSNNLAARAIEAVIGGIALGIERAIARKFAGPDLLIGIVPTAR